MRICTKDLVNETHSHGSRRAAAPHPHTYRQVVGFHLFEEVLRKKRVNGSSWQDNSAQHTDKRTHRACRYCVHVHI